ncbi:MAG: hypothetical protein KIT33_13810 [Candidatus Kapabacteria bacterium]|nr:hypothetical protein [Ignavibacteriota bacterium]MCW5886041.1 hypothetical protein [Candidatus Kapabacteria bacterium]
MSEVTINIPRTTRHAKVGLTDNFHYEEFSGKSSDMQAFINEHKKRRRTATLMAERKKEQAKKTVFTEKFVVSNTNQPINIDLKKVTEPTLTLDEAKLEIQEAYDKGFSDGHEAAGIAYQNEVEKYKDWIGGFDTLSQELRSEFSRFIVKMEESVVPSAILIAKHILMREIELDSEVVLQQAKKAIRSIDEEAILRISVNPGELEILKSAKSSLISDKAIARKIEINADEHINKGGCIITTSAGIIDASIEAQLEKIQASLLGIQLGN